MEISFDYRNMIIEGFYDEERNIEAPYTRGLYGALPAGKVDNYLVRGRHSQCGDYMTFCYNNPYQYNVDEIFDYRTKSYKNGGYFDASRANDPKLVGSMKEIFKSFEAELINSGEEISDMTIDDIEDEFWNYYTEKHGDAFNKGVNRLEEYVAEKRAKLTPEQRQEEKEHLPELLTHDETWIAGCKDFFEHLIRITPRGFMAELTLMNAVSKICDCEYQESTKKEESQGIDGYFVFSKDNKVPVCLKPISYKKMDEAHKVSPVNNRCMVYYYKDDKGNLKYEFDTGLDVLEYCEEKYAEKDAIDYFSKKYDYGIER